MRFVWSCYCELYVFILLCWHNVFSIDNTQSLGCSYIWLHSPKTASTFCLTIQHACNASEFHKHVNSSTNIVVRKGCAMTYPVGTAYGNRWHNPVNNYGLLHRHVGIFREPKHRILSSFLDSIHFEGLPRKLSNKLKNSFQAATTPQECVINFNIYLSLPCNYGCYTKMLNGLGCHADVELTEAMLKHALFVVNQFFFVGVFEKYEESIRLFLEMSDISRNPGKSMNDLNIIPHDIELRSVRFTSTTADKVDCKSILTKGFLLVPSSHSYSNSTSDPMMELNAETKAALGAHAQPSVPLIEYEDVYDSTIYRFVLLKYEEQLRSHSMHQHGI